MIIIPNGCSNIITVKGKPEKVKQFILENFKSNKSPYNDKCEEVMYVLDFEQFDPTPIDEQTGEIIDNWYNWRLEHWGCKWSPSFEQFVQLTVEYEDENKKPEILYDKSCYPNEEKDNAFTEEFINTLDCNGLLKLEVICSCETPWGPPEGIFNQWYEKYKELEVSLKFYEPGCELVGELWFSGEDFCETFKDKRNIKEWVQYLLEEGWESMDWYIEDCSNMIREMESKEVSEILVPKIEEMLSISDVEKCVVLIADIQEKYYNWLNKPEEKNN